MGLLKLIMEVELELELFGPERHDAIFDWVKYIISKKSGITYIISHNFEKIKVDS